MTGIGRRAGLALIAIASLATACDDRTKIGSGTTDTTAGSGVETTVDTSGATTTAAASTTAVPATTAAPATTATPATTAAPATTTGGGGGGCPGAGGIPGSADVGASISGDIDGDLANDTVTEYSLDGVPHVHAQLASGGQSDAEVAIGFADHVQISFEDFDYSLGAPTKPPVAVLAVGATKAGTAVFTFLTLTTGYCIRPWHSGSDMYVGRIAADGPYEGLSCEIAAGNRYYTLNEATQTTPGGDWTVHQTLINHNFTTITFTDMGDITVPDGPDVQHHFGDFYGCDHAPMFP